MLSEKVVFETLDKMIDEHSEKFTTARVKYCNAVRLQRITFDIAKNIAATDIRLSLLDYEALQEISRKERTTCDELNACESALHALCELRRRLSEANRKNDEDYDERWEEPRE